MSEQKTGNNICVFWECVICTYPTKRKFHFPGTLNRHFTLTFHSADAGKQEKSHHPSDNLLRKHSRIASSSFTLTVPFTHQTCTVLFENTIPTNATIPSGDFFSSIFYAHWMLMLCGIYIMRMSMTSSLSNHESILPVTSQRSFVSIYSCIMLILH